MRKKRLLVSDIDGTLLDNGAPTPGLETLRLVLYAHRDEVRLIYATGRSFESTRDLVVSGALPGPDGIAAFVGTEVWLPPWERQSRDFGNAVSQGWDLDAVLAVAAAFPALEPQPGEFQTLLKASYYLEDAAALPVLEKSLEDVGAGARLIYSCNRYLDIVPARAGKRNAVEFICRRWGADPRYVLVCGDSGNDLDMLQDPQFRGVAVGNSEEEVRCLVKAGPLHESSLPYAAGVLEGAEAFDFWRTS
jgi:sucrose-6F-phosphate phosphohydrolase